MPSKNIVYVYPDVVFLISLSMNALILWGTRRLAQLKAGKTRILCGAVFGALYSAAAAYPHLAFIQTFWVKTVFGLMMFLVTFLPVNLKRVVPGMLYFYLVSFSIGGIFFGVIFMLNTPFAAGGVQAGFAEVIRSRFLGGFLITVSASYLLIKVGLPFFKKNRLHGVLRVPLKVMFGDAHFEVEALVDTGNQLQDPFTQLPVVVVEYGVIKGFLPDQVHPYFEDSGADLTRILVELLDDFWVTRFRVIPFSSIGKENGMLLGFRPDQIQVRKGEDVVTKSDVLIGIYNNKLSPEGNYRALLHPEILQEISA